MYLKRDSNLGSLYYKEQNHTTTPAGRWATRDVILILLTDIQGRSQNLRHFYPDMGLKLGVFGFFP